MDVGLEDESGVANADDFCTYLQNNLLAYWKANGVLMCEATDEGLLKVRGTCGWLADETATREFSQSIGRDLLGHAGSRNQVLYPSVENRFPEIELSPLQDKFAAIAFVGDHSHSPTVGGLFVTFEQELDIASIEQIRRTFPMLRASLNFFIHSLHRMRVPPGQSLTRRQVAILQQILDGVPYNDISKTLFVSESTVKQEAKRIFQTLGVRNRFEAARTLSSRP